MQLGARIPQLDVAALPEVALHHVQEGGLVAAGQRRKFDYQRRFELSARSLAAMTVQAVLAGCCILSERAAGNRIPGLDAGVANHAAAGPVQA